MGAAVSVTPAKLTLEFLEQRALPWFSPAPETFGAIEAHVNRGRPCLASRAALGLQSARAVQTSLARNGSILLQVAAPTRLHALWNALWQRVCQEACVPCSVPATHVPTQEVQEQTTEREIPSLRRRLQPKLYRRERHISSRGSHSGARKKNATRIA